MRQPGYPIDTVFLERVSSRAFSEEPLTTEELMILFEAARWAPSSYNNQPWRFVFAKRGTQAFNSFFDILVDFNKQWIKNADILVLVVSKNNFEHNNKESLTAAFDTGAAWMSLAIQATLKNIIAHCIQGFDYECMKEKLQIPNNFSIQAMIALGKPGNIDKLPAQIRTQESPSDRKPLKEIISEGVFPFT